SILGGHSSKADSYHFILAQMLRLARIARPQQKNGVKLLLAAAALCIAPGLALAQSNDRWISDQFEVTLRNGKSVQQSIIRVLPTGTKVTVLEQDDESGYTRVRTSDGIEGWLLTRYLMSSQTARLQLPQLQTRLRNIEETRRRLQERTRELERQRRDLQTQLGRSETSSRGLQKQLDEIRKLSSDTIQLADQNKQLKEQQIDNERHIKELESENSELSNRSNQEWFILGAAVLMFGLLLGLIIPRIRWRRSRWSDF
ncbi:MAG: TIGR04211 family SH3 domain-containing protein, partial [Candidatus Binatia bacterium]